MKTIPLTRGCFALVDDDQFPILSQYKWSLGVTNDGNTYARRYSRRKSVFMHSMVFGAIKGQQLDHRDGNGLNNQRSNLRLCNCSQNGANMRMKSNNTSGFKGVCFARSKATNGKKYYLYWLARITINRKVKHLGSFYDKREAAKAYDEAATAAWGEFALTNKKLGLL